MKRAYFKKPKNEKNTTYAHGGNLMKKFKRMTSLVLAAMMVISLFTVVPFTANAAEVKEVEENTCTISVAGHGDWIDRYQNFLALPFTDQGFTVEPSEHIWYIPGHMWMIDTRSDYIDTVKITAPEGKMITNLGCKGNDIQSLVAIVNDENGERQIGLTSVNGVLTFQGINSSSVVIMNKYYYKDKVSDFVISFTDDPNYEEPKAEEPTVEPEEPIVNVEEPTTQKPTKPHHYYDMILP